jgi:hypothetical protein
VASTAGSKEATGSRWIGAEEKFDESMSSGTGKRIKGGLECMASRRFHHFNAMAFAKRMSKRIA